MNIIAAQISDGTFLSKWGNEGSENGQFSWPYGIAIDNTGNIYVADTDNDRIQKFTYSDLTGDSWNYQ